MYVCMSVYVYMFKNKIGTLMENSQKLFFQRSQYVCVRERSHKKVKESERPTLTLCLREKVREERVEGLR